jgi:glyoxylase-like metal-dependent hydrolase (beta-lactamase superfamily II)
VRLPAQAIETRATDGSTVHGVRIGPVDVFFGEKSGKFPDGNQVIVRGKDSLAVFDTPMVSNRIEDQIKAADIAILGHVHEDHVAGLHLIPQTPVHVPAEDLGALQSHAGLGLHYGYRPHVTQAMVERARTRFHFTARPQALAYKNDATWDLGQVKVRSIHMPGHTGGHSVLLVEPQGIAFIGDIDLSSFGPYYGDACSDLTSFRDSLRRLESVPACAWITSHHKGVITDHEQFLHMLRQFSQAIERRQERLLAALSASPATLADLVAMRFVYPVNFNDLYVQDVERRTISQHLASMLATGRVRRDGEIYLVP